ncbi:hypothetical protein CYV19_02820 [Natronobacterium gregoryi SP2]|nr:hypothetical protein [Natronobacterium gregoryi]ELY72458.1 hypothetical protein C490_03903 [Natronobacterium gregoryi SP2]PLK21781.1 hypothetical protein CYV19_02820 [Natronobacterium gregoryi SP2]
MCDRECDGDSSGGFETRRDTPVDAVLAGSDGCYYTEWQVKRRFRTGDWRRCLRQWSPDRRLVETATGTLLLLEPIDPERLPGWVEIRVLGDATRVVDTRRSHLSVRW